jgi:hypothetical protein
MSRSDARMANSQVRSSRRLVGCSALGIAVVGALLCPSSASADEPTGEQCQNVLNPAGALAGGVTHLPNRAVYRQPVDIDDDMETVNTDWWKYVQFTDSCMSMQGGDLRVKIPAGARTSMYADSEYMTRSAYPNRIGPGQKPTEFSARVRGTDLSGVYGTRGWGYFHTALLMADSDWALFMYLRSSAKASDTTVPNGFYAMTARAGSGLRFFKLPDKLLRKDHIYAVKWHPNRVEFFIDGRTVAIEEEIVPRNRLTVSLWVDNARYNAHPSIHAPLILRPSFAPTPKDNILTIDWATVH